MPFEYSQTSGILRRPSGFQVKGYSGHGPGLNNPFMQAEHDVGPIPCGKYTIGPAFTHPQLGPVAMRLTPDPANKMYGRGDFLLHGDNQKLDHSASHGCIILPHDARVMISRIVGSGDSQLTVVREFEAVVPFEAAVPQEMQ